MSRKNGKKMVFAIASALALVCFLIAMVMILTGKPVQSGLFLTSFFLALAIYFFGKTYLKAFTYPTVIFAAVTLALYYPQYFIELSGFKFTTLITPLLQLIMFGMGTSMSIKDFAGVVKMPRGVLIGVFSHFLIMPSLGFALANLSGFPPEIAAGIILIGCSPNGMASNVISYLAKANLALSITITAVSTLLAPIMTPLLMKLLAGAFIQIDILEMMFGIIKMVILPIGAGLLFNKFLSGRAKWFDDAMPLVSMFGITCTIIIITAAGRDSLLNIGPLLIMVVLAHNLSGYTLGYWTGRLFKMNERDCRTIAIEVGMQNGSLASGIAKEMGKIATVGLAPAVFGPLMNITGSLLASYWHKKPPEKKVKIKKSEASEQYSIVDNGYHYLPGHSLSI
jgi:bile acid:Na+ symporter, BASS family